MGRSVFVTITVREYAALQRIVGTAHACVRAVPAIYSKEVAPLRVAVDEYENGVYSALAREAVSPTIGTAA